MLGKIYVICCILFVGFGLCIFVGPAGVLFIGVFYAIVAWAKVEIANTKSEIGRKIMQKQQEEQKYVEEYWGIPKEHKK